MSSFDLNCWRFILWNALICLIIIIGCFAVDYIWIRMLGTSLWERISMFPDWRCSWPHQMLISLFWRFGLLLLLLFLRNLLSLWKFCFWFGLNVTLWFDYLSMRQWSMLLIRIIVVGGGVIVIGVIIILFTILLNRRIRIRRWLIHILYWRVRFLILLQFSFILTIILLIIKCWVSIFYVFISIAD